MLRQNIGSHTSFRAVPQADCLIRHSYPTINVVYLCMLVTTTILGFRCNEMMIIIVSNLPCLQILQFSQKMAVIKNFLNTLQKGKSFESPYLVRIQNAAWSERHVARASLRRTKYPPVPLLVLISPAHSLWLLADRITMLLMIPLHRPKIFNPYTMSFVRRRCQTNPSAVIGCTEDELPQPFLALSSYMPCQFLIQCSDKVNSQCRICKGNCFHLKDPPHLQMLPRGTF